MKFKHLILSASLGFAAFFLGLSPASAAVAPSLGAAESFAVLGGTAVTCTGSVVTGDVGSAGAAATIVNTGCTINGATIAPVSTAVLMDFYTAYDALATDNLGSCTALLPAYTDTTLTLPPGVYCSDAGLTFTRTTLTLAGGPSDVWIFLVGTGTTGALTGTNFSVVMSGGAEPCVNNVFWRTAEAATLTDSFFFGNILSGTAITVTDGSLGGRAFAKAAVTLTRTDVSACGSTTPGGKCGIKVTGGGQIPVPNPDSNGRATFGFNAKGNADGTGSGHFNYVNHVTGLHVNGDVDSVAVIARNPDGSPKTIRFSGSCSNSPQCSFSVTAEDHGERGTKDQLGVTVTGGLSEFRSQRVISRGNIQFHKIRCDCEGKKNNHKGKGGHDENDDDDDDNCDDGHGHDHNGGGDDHSHGDSCGKGKGDR